MVDERFRYLEVPGQRLPMPQRQAETDAVQLQPSAALRALIPIGLIGKSDEGTDLLHGPTGIAVDSRSNLYVADTYNHRLLKITDYGQAYPMGAQGRHFGQMAQPVGVLVDALQFIYVLDRRNECIHKFRPSLDVLFAFGRSGVAPGCLKAPEAMARGPLNNIYVADTANGRIQSWNHKGQFEGVVVQLSTDPRYFRPVGIAVDQHGRIFVADAVSERILVFSSDGAALGALGGPGVEPGQFTGLRGLAVTEDGAIIVVESGNGRLQVLSWRGEPLAVYGYGAPGQVELMSPEGVAIGPDGSIYLTDRRANRIIKFAWA